VILSRCVTRLSSCQDPLSPNVEELWANKVSSLEAVVEVLVASAAVTEAAVVVSVEATEEDSAAVTEAAVAVPAASVVVVVATD
jgi:hypothetical protein